jgi:5-(carboxyamino)imidazole ribonucleotide mutase
MSSVAVIMGSTSDLVVMQEAVDILKTFGVSVEVDIVSAHRTPEKLVDFAKKQEFNRRMGLSTFYSSNARRRTCCYRCT